VITGILCAPTLRSDGFPLERLGYDADTGLYLDFQGTIFPPIPRHPSRDDALAAIAALLEVFIDFPFATKYHRSAALAAVLSVPARFTIQGNVPFFAVRATSKGAGKGLLIDTFSVIGTGRPAPRWAQTRDEDEERKRLMTIALAGDVVLHLDNVTHALGSGPLNMALTSGTITDRMMGTHTERTAPIQAVFFGSGNNMILEGDFARRVVPIDLAPREEHPDQREHFTHHPLLDWVHQERPRLVIAALTVLKAYIVAGKPPQADVPAFGSYEPWSDLVRHSLVWAGQPDPCFQRQAIEAESTPEYELHRRILTAWHDLYKSDAKTVQMVVDDIEQHTVQEPDTRGKPGRWLTHPDYRDLQHAFIAVNLRRRELDANAVSYKFRAWRGRVVGGLMLEKIATTDRHGSAFWRVDQVEG
jgi:hypothetical protein